MKIQFSLVRQALVFGLALVLLTGCLAPLPTPVPGSGVIDLNIAPTQAADNLPPQPTPSPAPPTPTVFVTPASDLAQMPNPLEGWQQGNSSAPITLAEYADFQ
jgi:hypothetical protein